MIEQLFYRILRAVGFAAAAAVGMHWGGFGVGPILTVASVITVLFLLGILQYGAAVGAALLLIWGGLVTLELAPDANALAFWKKQAQDAAVQKLPELAKAVASPSPAAADPGSLSKKLADLKDSCDKGLLTKDECDALRAKIVDGAAK